MPKGIRSATVSIFIGSFFILSGHSAGQGTVEISQLPLKQTYLTQKEQPMDITLQSMEKEVHKANTEVTTSTQPKPKTVEKEQPKPQEPKYTELTVTATAYVSFCDTGCIGITATGTNVKKTITHPSGLGIIAVDPTIIPLGSIVEINGKQYIADDTGGAIKGHKIDILVDTHNTKKAFKFGKQKLVIKVLH